MCVLVNGGHDRLKTGSADDETGIGRLSTVCYGCGDESAAVVVVKHAEFTSKAISDRSVSRAAARADQRKAAAGGLLAPGFGQAGGRRRRRGL